MKELILKLLEEVDSDIKDSMLFNTEEKFSDSKLVYEAWQYLPDPMNTILNWQAMRDRKKK